MDTHTLQHIFLSGAGLSTTSTDDDIMIGTLLPSYSPAGFDAVLRIHTRLIDEMLSFSGLPLYERIELTAMRGFTFHEYSTSLFDLTIKEKDFDKYPVFKALFIASDKERRERVIYFFDRNSHGDYKTLLAQVLTQGHPHLAKFLYSDEITS